MRLNGIYTLKLPECQGSPYWKQARCLNTRSSCASVPLYLSHINITYIFSSYFNVTAQAIDRGVIVCYSFMRVLMKR